MMAFNPATFNAASLLAASQPATPVKEDADAAIRLLAAGGPLFGGGGLPGFPGMGLPFPVYPGMQPEMKPDMLPPAGGGPLPGYFFDAMGYHPYAGGLDGARRKNATRETTSALKAWLNDHRKNPYPTKGEKVMLAVMTKMTLTQVSTWFANARRRLKKENKMTWSPRNRPGEDDDLADLDALDESARPGSSASNCSNKDGDFSLSNNNDDDKASPAPSGDSDSPRKKIWSIAEQLNEATTSAGATATTQSDEQPAAAEWQQQMGLAMQRLAAMQQQQQRAAAPPMPAMHGLPPMFMPMLGGLHPMLLMMQQAAAAAAAAQTAPAPSNQDANGSWSDRPSLSPSASPVAEASLKQEDACETVKQEEQ